jgi:hypothetical protein
MKKIVFLIGITLLKSSLALGQRIILHGKMSDGDFKLVERVLSEIFDRTSLINLSLYHENTLLTKVDRNNLPDHSSIAGYYSFNETFVEALTCAKVTREIGKLSKESFGGKISINFVDNLCGDFNSDLNSFLASSIAALNTIGSRPYLNLFFINVKPTISVSTRIGSNSVLVDKNISGQAKSVSGGNLFILEDGKVTSIIPISGEWQTTLNLNSPIKVLKIFAVGTKGDTSDVIAYSNISFKEITPSSLKMLHPGGQIKPNGVTSDVVNKCNTQTMNGFYNFQFLVDKDLKLDSVVLNFEDLTMGRVLKRRNFYNVDETLKSILSQDNGFVKVCVYLLYSEMNFKNPCDIEDSYLYYLSYRLPNGNRVETPKKQIFFESFRENYDEFPCRCN